MQELLTLVTRTRRSFMGRDLDALMDCAFAASLETLSGIPAAQLHEMTFDEHVIDLTSVDQPKSGVRRWVLSKSTQNRRPTEAWLQFCPSCLREDSTPFFRRHWRYAFMTTCAVHRTRLETHCPACDRPFDFESYDIVHAADGRIVPVTVCSHCDEDVRSHFERASSAPAGALQYERALLAAARRGWTRIRAEGWVYSHQVLDVLHRLLRQLRGSRELQLSFEASIEPRSAFRPACRIPAGRFESWPIAIRHAAMGWISGLLRGWPDHFVNECTRFHVLRSALHGHRGELPYWFDRILLEHLYRPWSKPSAEEIASARQAICRSGQPDTVYNVRRWLGFYCQPGRYVQNLGVPSPEQIPLFEEEERRKRMHEQCARRFPSREEFEHVRGALELARVRKRRSRLDLYDVWCAVLYHLYTKCPLTALPRDFPNPQTVRWYLVRWKAHRYSASALHGSAIRRLLLALSTMQA